ncbi:hypothetical protein SAMN02745196_01711 [Clostridium collagenovorans DSM 3089]|uniref:Uncharacterized protein n=1 Tax=Clostridium collagenovorans DSM 3089 TaxID=1121306 RepID=A0A1M5WKX3_9CLOT|nr:hypothetical protein [Clostridium collagenovorans]SHH88175.1 hypothetical protein SAMN02745196_01711 [Clostridium collagenovorans DSM 3089]
MLSESLNKTPIQSHEALAYCSIIQLGDWSYATKLSDSYIYKLDKEGETKERILTDKPYSKICYDSYEDCIWAITLDEQQSIYKLNLEFKEIYEINLAINYPIRNISHDYYSNKLYITTDQKIFMLNKDGSIDNSITSKRKIEKFLDVFKVGSYIYIALTSNNKTSIVKLDNSRKSIEQVDMKDDLVLEKIMIWKEEDEYKVSYLGRSNDNENKIVFIDELQIEESKNRKGINLKDFTQYERELFKGFFQEYSTSNNYGGVDMSGIDICDRNYFSDPCDNNNNYDDGRGYDPCREYHYCPDWCNEDDPCKKQGMDPCDNPCNDPCNRNCNDPCDDPCDNPCNNPCHDHCHDHCHNHCPGGSGISKCQSITDIIESIALIETGLAHIINAEGEKIQKVIATTDDVNLINKTNETVTKLITKVTFLEQVLLEKLECALKVDCDKKKSK